MDQGEGLKPQGATGVYSRGSDSIIRSIQRLLFLLYRAYSRWNKKGRETFSPVLLDVCYEPLPTHCTYHVAELLKIEPALSRPLRLCPLVRAVESSGKHRGPPVSIK